LWKWSQGRMVCRVEITRNQNSRALIRLIRSTLMGEGWEFS
jgi:hypothetical protein